MMILVMVMILFTTIINSSYIFRSHTQSLKVIEVDAARSCMERYSSISGRPYRTEVPSRISFGFCGYIYTDKGFYKLPPSRAIRLMHQPREHLYDRLEAGCTYRVTISGPGGRYHPSERQRVPLRQEISRIKDELGCP